MVCTLKTPRVLFQTLQHAYLIHLFAFSFKFAAGSDFRLLMWPIKEMKKLLAAEREGEREKKKTQFYMLVKKLQGI